MAYLATTDDGAHQRPITKPTLPYATLSRDSKQFRILIILPGTFYKPLHCRLEYADLGAQHVPKFETISYCWGDATSRVQITVNGDLIEVPASAAAALRRMRLPGVKRAVWLDAICINQQNDGERQQQLSIMPSIYRNGLRNLIYLGEEDIEQALRSIELILGEARGVPSSFTLLRNEVGTWQYSNSGISVAYDAPALLKFYAIPWFRRLWVLQEAALAGENTCFCGSSEFDLLDATRVAAWLLFHYYFVDEHLRLQCSYAADMNDLIDTEHGYHNTKTGQTAGILYLLDLAQQRLSTLAVDKIYGILGLTADVPEGEPRLAITPDYSKRVEDVYREAAWCILKSSGDLQILDYVRHWTTVDGQLQLENFASWVPKWHRSKDLNEHPMFMSLTFDVCLGKKAIILEQGNREPAILSVAGVLAGQVRQTTRRILADENGRIDFLTSILEEAESMVDGTIEKGSDAITHGERLAVAMTLVAGVDVRCQPAGPEILGAYEAFRRLAPRGVLQATVSSIKPTDDDETVLAIQYAEATYNACMNRKFFVTQNGYFGLGPHFMTEGDIVVVLYGLQWPAVLRRIDGGDCLFLGTAYVSGIMSGELMQRHESEGKGDDVFRLQ